MATYEIWMEGFAVTGQHQGAHYIGSAEGENFIEACENFRQPKTVMNPNTGKGIRIEGEEEGLKLDRNPDGSLRLSVEGNPSIWACTLYDNESDARKGFG